MNGPRTPVDTQRQQPISKLNLDLTKLVLEFISRCFYPTIIVVVLILIAPGLREIDFKTLFGRLQSAKAFGTELAFSQAQDVGADTAALNNKIADLERTVAALRSDLQAVQQKIGPTPAIEAAQKERAVQEKQFQENSKFTVLVFHTPNGRALSGKIATALLQAGYKASSTETDFSELQKTHPSGTVYVTHNTEGEAILPQISSLLKSFELGSDLKIQRTTTDLRRGEVQILVF